VTLSGRTVLITGAARGIGAATARAVAARGARVSLVGLEPHLLSALAGELGEEHAWFEADVTDQAALEEAVADTMERLGGLDVVVANAGIASYTTVRMLDPEAFARTIDINLTGAFRTVRAALPHVIERRGYVLVVASLASFAPLGGMAAHAASKAGVDFFAASLRMELAHLGVDVGRAYPSWIDTDLVRDALRDLKTVRRMRATTPWPVRATTSAEACGEALADGIERRARTIFVPRSVALLYWLRPLLGSRLSEAVTRVMGARLIPALEAEAAALGRATSEPAAGVHVPLPDPPPALEPKPEDTERAPAA
jgi:NAD(P)-dependent dehydrogenase (short-subunit alcohol dehydrogenase family)